MITQISYNVLIERFRAFAEAHFLIKGFSHGDLSNIDIEKDVEFPWMHVLPVEVEPRAGTRLYSFVIIFADLPRDKETPAEYQRECISDCIKLAEDVLAEIQNGQVVFGPLVELDGGANIEVFINEFSHTLVGVNLQLTLSVPWDWSACDIPADFTIGGSGSGGTGSGVGLTLQTNGVNNGLQSLLNLQQGTNVTIVDNGNGTVTINSSGGGGGGGGTVTSVSLTVPSAFTVSGSPITGAGTLAISGAGTSGDYIDGTGALQTFPALATVATSGDYGDLINQPFIPENLKDLQDVSATIATNGQVLTFNSLIGEWEPQTPTVGGTVTSVGLTMPNAFTVTGSPVTTAGTLAVTAVGTSSQYITGDGQLANFPALTGFVPYTGATQDVDLDANKLSAESIYIEGTNGAGHLHLKHQNADATATGQSTALWADNNGDIKWKNDGNYKTTLKSSGNTADRVYTFPNEDAELMPRNAAITGATKTKITYDADGLVTAGADLVAGDIPTGIDAANIASGNVSNTEFEYLDGVTSAIQTQLDAKKDTFTLRAGVGPVAPADATTYYAGEGTLGLSTVATLYDSSLPFACKLIGAHIQASNNAGNATSELSTINFRFNNTTDVLISNAVSFGGTQPISNTYAITGLNQTLAAGDTYVIKWTTPTWATNPTGAQLLLTLYFERI